MSNEETKRDEYPVIPTIFIGLGGSGKEVLLRIRRRFFTKYRMASLPVTRFLWVDTDAQCVGISQERDVIDKRVDFQPEEVVDISVDSTTLTNIYNLKHENKHIFNWYSERLRELGDQILQHGAGQIRSAGRLAFWLYIQSRFKPKLEQAAGALENPVALERMLADVDMTDLRVDKTSGNKKTIVIIGSLAGGTGAGTFLDAGFYCRMCYPNSDIIGHFFLPGVFERLIREKRAQTFANSYAALKELNYYIAPPMGVSVKDKDDVVQQFTFEWNNKVSPKLSTPYNQIFLLEDKNIKNTLIERPTDLFEVSAEALCMDFEPSRFGQQKRSNRSNVWQFSQKFFTKEYYYDAKKLNRTDEKLRPLHAVKFRRAYASYGIASLVYDRHRLRNGAAYYVGSQLCRFWLGEFRDSEDLVNFFRDKVKDVLGEERLIEALLMDEDKISKTEKLRNRVNIELNDLRKRIGFINQGESFETQKEHLQTVSTLADQIRVKAQDIYDRILKDLTDKQTGKLRKGPEENLDGKHRRLIRRNKGKVTKAKCNRLQEEMIGLLTEPKEYGLSAAREFLRAAEVEITEILNRPDSDTDSITALDVPLPKLPDSSQINDLHRKYVDAKKIPSAFWPYAGIAERHFRARLEGYLADHLKRASDALNKYLDEVGDRIVGNLVKVYRRVVEEVLGTEGFKDFYSYIKTYVGRQQKIEKDSLLGDKIIKATGLQLNLQSYEDAISKVKKEQEEYFVSFMNNPPEDRNQLAEKNLDLSAKINEHLVAKLSLRGEQSQRQIYQEVSKRFLSECGFYDEQKPNQDMDIVVRSERDAMKTLVERSKEPRSDNWREVIRKLEEFGYEMFSGFLYDNNALEEISDLGLEELDRQASTMVSMALPWSPISESGKEYKNREDEHQQARAFLGIPLGGKSKAANKKDIVDMVRKHLGNNHINNPLTIEDTPDGSVSLYIEDAALPSFYFGSLKRYKEEYTKEIAQGEIAQCSRHSDRRWEKFPDLLLPARDEDWVHLHDALKTFLESLIIGEIRFGLGEGFYYRSMDMGVAKKRPIGYSIDASVDRMIADKNLENEIKQKMLQKWSTIVDSENSLLKVLKCYQQYNIKIFPDLPNEVNIRSVAIRSSYDEAVKIFEERYISPADRKNTETFSNLLANKLSRISIEEYVEVIDYYDYNTYNKPFQIATLITGI